MPSFRDYTAESSRQITFVEGGFYPEILDAGREIYRPVLESFGQLIHEATDSANLLRRISNLTNVDRRVQLLRVFKKYVSPDTSVELLKMKTKIPQICADFGHKFRPLSEVRAAYASRPVPDEAIIAILNEYRERGSKGYTLTGTFFEWFAPRFPDFTIEGPVGAGPDVNLGKVFRNYPTARRPVDFLIKENDIPLAVGLARYDSDRGGAQEDDRTSGYRNVATEILNYANGAGMTKLKVIFINDGPGLLCGSMWKDYSELEDFGRGRILVTTIKMLNDRLTADWLRS